MDNLVFSLNATVPIFLMMILGLFFNKIGWMDEEFANKMNKFVFRIPLPVLLFGRSGGRRYQESVGYEICNLLFYYYIDQYHDRNRNLLPVERQKYSGRIYPGSVQKQCGTSGDRIYPEYLW